MTPATRILPLLILAIPTALACGGDGETDTDGRPAAEAGAAAEAPVPEAPGLPFERTDFSPSGAASGSGITGTLWVATSQPGGPDGVSLVAQLRGLPPGQAFSWTLHRGACQAPDQPVLRLGYGTEAVAGDADRSEQGGPLGETRPAFEPAADGRAEETVWIPFDGAVDQTRFETETYSLRIHPSAGAGEMPPSVACARVPVVSENSRPRRERR